MRASRSASGLPTAAAPGALDPGGPDAGPQPRRSAVTQTSANVPRIGRARLAVGIDPAADLAFEDVHRHRAVAQHLAMVTRTSNFGPSSCSAVRRSAWMRRSPTLYPSA